MKTLTSYIFEKFRISKDTISNLNFFEWPEDKLISKMKETLKEYNRRNNRKYDIEVNHTKGYGDNEWLANIINSGYSYSYPTLSELYYSIIHDWGTSQEFNKIKNWKYDTDKKEWIKRT